MASPVQLYFLWSLLGVGGFRGPMFPCFGKESQSFQLLATNGGGAQRWLLFLCQHIHIQVGKDTIFPISFHFLLHRSHHLAFCEKTLKFSAGFCLRPPRFIVFYLRGCGHCRRMWVENPGHLGEGEPPK